MGKPKILFFDIETSPNIGYTWEKYQQDVIAFREDWQLLSVAYKFEGDRKIRCITRQGEDSDLQLCKKLYKIMKEADIIIAHNGDEFDIKKAKARFLVHNLPPLPPVASVDTKKVAKRYFKFTSNKLDDLGRQLSVGRKAKHQGFDLWLGCMSDKTDSWKTMIHYNKQDVALLERVYNKLKPHMTNHPSIAALNRTEGCPSCGSTNLSKWGIRPTPTGLQQRWACKSCGAYHVKGRVK